MKHHPYSVLIAEDEEKLRKQYAMYLSKKFQHVYEASDGEEAYRLYCSLKPQILLLDINMPRLDGLSLLRRIRQNDHATRAIILTAYSDQERILEACELKLTKYLIKPFHFDDFKDAFETAMQELEQFITLSRKTLQLKDDYAWDYEKRKLYCKGESVKLTKKERLLLDLLFRHPDTEFTHEQILYEFWPDSESGDTSPLKTAVKKLRRKLPPDTICTIYGVGYKLKLD